MRISMIVWAFLLESAGLAIAGGPYYVSPGAGNDANDGLTEEEAWLTIPHAEQYAANGSTIYLMNGTYPATVTIDRNSTARQGATPTSWADAVTFRNAPGHTPMLTPQYFLRNQNRYIIWDSVHILATWRTAGSYAVQVDSSGYVKWHDCNLEGTITIDPNDGESRWGEYTNYVVKLGSNVPSQHVNNLIFDGCMIHHGGLHGIQINSYSWGGNQIVGCDVHNCGNGIQCTPPVDGTGAGDLIYGNTLHNQSMCWTPANDEYVHGSGISLNSHCSVMNNIVFAWGTTSPMTCYLLAGSSQNGNTFFNGTWEDTAKKFTAGEIVTQVMTGAKGRVSVHNYPAAPGLTTVWIERATDALAFDTSHDIVADDHADRIFHVTSIGTTYAWGGFHGMVVKNNILCNNANATEGLLWYYLGDGNQIINNTWIGPISGRSDGYLYLANWYVYEYQYGLTPSSNVICSNILGLNVPAIPAPSTFKGNICFSVGVHQSQATVDANHPGNLVLCDSTTDNEDGYKLWTGGEIFAGGGAFDTYVCAMPARDPATQTIQVAAGAWVYTDIGHKFDLIAGSEAIGFADPINYTGTDFWGDARDTYPDSGYDELAGGFPPPIYPSGNPAYIWRQ
jgi:hypothetical protein